MQRLVEIRAKDLVKYTVAVWAKRDSIGLTVAADLCLPFFRVDDMHSVRQRIIGSAHYAGPVRSSLIADDLALHIGIDAIFNRQTFSGMRIAVPQRAEAVSHGYLCNSSFCTFSLRCLSRSAATAKWEYHT